MLSKNELDKLFYEARTFNAFTDRRVEDDTIKSLYNLMKWGPTAFNCQPARYLFLKSKEERARLLPHMMEGNRVKTEKAPMTVIIAQDSQFYEFLPEQFPAMDMKSSMENNKDLAYSTAFRGSSMQGAYFIIAARALGLDVGPMTGFNFEAVNKEFFSDGRWEVNFIANFGYGDVSGNYPRGPRLDFDTVARIL